MNEMKIFENEEFGQIRSIVIDEKPWFIGKDVALALKYGQNSNGNSKSLSNAIKYHVDEQDRRLVSYGDLKGYSKCDLKNVSHYGCIVINESGLYSLILGSQLKTAKKFKRWITSEVLPALHRNGIYSMNKEDNCDLNENKLAEIVAQATVTAFTQCISSFTYNIIKELDERYVLKAELPSKEITLPGQSTHSMMSFSTDFERLASTKAKEIGKKFGMSDHESLSCIYRRMGQLGVDMNEVRETATAINPLVESSVLKQIATLPSCHIYFFKAVEDILRA